MANCTMGHMIRPFKQSKAIGCCCSPRTTDTVKVFRELHEFTG